MEVLVEGEEVPMLQRWSEEAVVVPSSDPHSHDEEDDEAQLTQSFTHLSHINSASTVAQGRDPRLEQVDVGASPFWLKQVCCRD